MNVAALIDAIKSTIQSLLGEQVEVRTYDFQTLNLESLPIKPVVIVNPFNASAEQLTRDNKRLLKYTVSVFLVGRLDDKQHPSDQFKAMFALQEKLFAGLATTIASPTKQWHWETIDTVEESGAYYSHNAVSEQGCYLGGFLVTYLEPE